MCVAKIRVNTLMFQMDMVDLTLILLGHQLECIGPSFLRDTNIILAGCFVYRFVFSLRFVEINIDLL